LLIDLCITDIIGTLLNIVNYETTRHSICACVVFSYYLLRRDVVEEPQGPCLKNQEIQDSWIQNKKYNGQDKKNEISYLENQDKTRNVL